MKKVAAIGLKLTLTTILLLTALNIWIIWQTKSGLYEEVNDVPQSKLALVLGTSKYVVGGGLNPFFENRMLAAAELYKAGKVSHILVSGDNSSKYYNEPQTMKDELVALGVPAEDITLDFAGLRTLDSIVRCKEVFGQDNFVVVTQQFHSYRALFISKYYNLNARAYLAEDVPLMHSPAVIIREFFARPLAVVDLFVLGTKPKHLGKKENLNI